VPQLHIVLAKDHYPGFRSSPPLRRNAGSTDDVQRSVGLHVYGYVVGRPVPVSGRMVVRLRFDVDRSLTLISLPVKYCRTFDCRAAMALHCLFYSTGSSVRTALAQMTVTSRSTPTGDFSNLIGCLLTNQLPFQVRLCLLFLVLFPDPHVRSYTLPCISCP